MSIKSNNNFQILHKKKDITKYNITNVYMTVLFIYDMQTVSVLALNNFLGGALHHNRAHTYLTLLSIAGILNAPGNNLHLYSCNSDLIEITGKGILNERVLGHMGIIETEDEVIVKNMQRTVSFVLRRSPM